jgi:uncharacterized protein YtpQ (UPF0354 family)
MKRRVLVGLAVPLVVALALHTSAVLADAFTERVRAAFAEETPEFRPTIRADGEIGLASHQGEWSVFLENLRLACTTRPADCEADIKSFVRRTTTVVRDRTSVGISSTNVFPVLRAEGYLPSTGRLAGNDPKKQITSRSFVSGTVLVYVLDTPDTLRFVNAEDLDIAGLSLKRVHSLAVGNVARLERLKVKPLRGASGIFVAIARDGLGTSRVLEPGFWQLLERKAGGPVAVATPTRDWILAARLDDPSALSTLRILAERVFRGEPYSVSPTLFRLDGVAWREIRP